MRKIRNIAWAVCLLWSLLWGLTACTDYLDVQPYGRTIPKTAEEFSALVHTLLNDVDEGNSALIDGISDRYAYDCGAGDNFEVCLTERGGSLLTVSQSQPSATVTSSSTTSATTAASWPRTRWQRPTPCAAWLTTS